MPDAGLRALKSIAVIHLPQDSWFTVATRQSFWESLTLAVESVSTVFLWVSQMPDIFCKSPASVFEAVDSRSGQCPWDSETWIGCLESSRVSPPIQFPVPLYLQPLRGCVRLSLFVFKNFLLGMSGMASPFLRKLGWSPFFCISLIRFSFYSLCQHFLEPLLFHQVSLDWCSF